MRQRAPADLEKGSRDKLKQLKSQVCLALAEIMKPAQRG